MLNYENATERCSVYLILSTYPLTRKDQPVYAVWAIIDVIVCIMKRNRSCGKNALFSLLIQAVKCGSHCTSQNTEGKTY